MTNQDRFHAIADLLRQTGPLTTAQIKARVDWPIACISSTLSRARSYGFIRVAERRTIVHSNRPYQQFLWDAAP